MPSIERPNIVVTMSDQQRTGSLACYGNVFVQSPHIYALEEGGVRFDDGFTPFPLCTPSRAALWTGRMPHTHGIMDCIYGVADAFAESPPPRDIVRPSRARRLSQRLFWQVASWLKATRKHTPLGRVQLGGWPLGRRQAGFPRRALSAGTTDRPHVRVPAATHGGHAAVLCRAELLPATRAVHSAETVIRPLSRQRYLQAGLLRSGNRDRRLCGPDSCDAG